MRRDPSEQRERLPQVAALNYFTDREDAIQAFRRYLHGADADALRVLIFYGVGGIGKTTLVQRLTADLRDARPPIPHALFSMENIGDQTRAYREVLLRCRCDLASQFGVTFPRFDMCVGVMLAREGGAPPALVRLHPSLRLALEFGTALIQAPVTGLPGAGEVVHLTLHGVAGLIKGIVEQTPRLEELVRLAGGTGDVVRLRERAMRDDQTLPEELIRRFAQDLKERLPARKDNGCRAVLFLDTYEALWSGREAAAAAQARLLDEWVRTLAEYCLGSGVLLVISGRDRPGWEEVNAQWEAALDRHLLGGLSAHDAQTFLARCGIGKAPVTRASPLQRAIVTCCNESTGPSEVSAHPLYLALCAEIVLNTRSARRIDPKPEMFNAIPTQQVARELATRFLRSLHNHALELWIQELSLTPRFDERAAVALDTARAHHNGRSAWAQLTHFSFVDPQPDGFYRLHKTMRDVLRTLVDAPTSRAVHEWFRDYWTDDPSLAWYHRWTLDPAGALHEWQERHERALATLQNADARQLLTWWAEIGLDESDRRRIGERVWAKTHLALAVALWKTPMAPRAAAVTAAIGHGEAALQVFTEADFREDWATTQHYLGTAHGDLPTGDRTENLRRALACYEAALRVRTESDFPQEWAMTQNNLGGSYWALPTGDRTENLHRAIGCYQAVLRVWTEADHPRAWAMAQANLGNCYADLPTGDRTENLRRAIACYEAALRVRTETEFPDDWANTQNNLGVAYKDLPAGDPVENLRRAMAYYEAALRVWTEANFPHSWAMTQNNLGNVHADLPAGDRAENLRRAIACYQAALTVLTETDYPYEWAGTQLNLGDAYAGLPAGDRAENLRRAIACYDTALRAWTEADFPLGWSTTMHHLGEAYRQLPAGTNDENQAHLRTAMGYFEAALRVRTEAGYPHDWAETQRALGLTYQALAEATGQAEYAAKAEEHRAAASRASAAG